MRFSCEADSSYEIEELITIIPPDLLIAIEVPKKNMSNHYDGAVYDIIAIISVAPAMSLEDLKTYLGQIWMGERMVRTVQPFEPEDALEETTFFYPDYIF
jgi:hypothetical protein